MLTNLVRRLAPCGSDSGSVCPSRRYCHGPRQTCHQRYPFHNLLHMPHDILPIAVNDTTQHCILGTAGHIDHGKTSLVKALTGIDAYRLPEEKRRGMTIELGFAEMHIGHVQFGVVDVPGHERFVKTMVAGATGIDVALLVVAADDSVMPQTREHVEILHLLGITQGVVAVTKIDTVESDMVEMVVEEVRELLAGSPLAEAPICPVSSITDEGIDTLRQTLVEVAGHAKRDHHPSPFRMCIDRVFTVPGRGTVVTGSVIRGMVSAGDALEVWPCGDTCRVRSLQAHGASFDMLEQGRRAAINLSGIDREALQRGSELATPGYLEPIRLVDVKLTYLSSNPKPLKSTQIVRMGIGTTELAVRAVLLKEKQLVPGQAGYAQLRSGQAFVATYGQRFILRDETASRTIGGGVVLRMSARRQRASVEDNIAALTALETGDDTERIAQVLREYRFTKPADLHVCARTAVALEQLSTNYQQLKADGRWIPIPTSQVRATPGAIDDLCIRLTRWLKRYHDRHGDEPGRATDAVIGWLGRLSRPSLAKPLFDLFVKRKAVKPFGRFTCLPEFAPTLSKADEQHLMALIGEMQRGGFQPPALSALAIAKTVDRKRIEKLATLAVAMGDLKKIEAKIFLHTESEQALRNTVSRLIQTHESVTIAQVREALNSSRKFVVPFMEYLDRIGFTKRTGDARILVDQTEPRP